MNNDLISRSELKKAIEQGEGFSWDSHGKDDLCVRKKYIDNAPTVAERPKGEWITHITYFECSNCEHALEYDYAEDIDPVTDLNYNFCPYCGAQMRGETDDG